MSVETTSSANPLSPSRRLAFEPSNSPGKRGAWNRLRPGLLAAFAILGIAGGQAGFIHRGLSVLTLGLYLLGALALVLLAWPSIPRMTRASLSPPLRVGDVSSPPVWIAAAGLISGGIAFGRTWLRHNDQPTTDILILWLLGLLLVLIACGWSLWTSVRADPGIVRRRWRAWRWDREIVIVGAFIVAIAILARVFMLDRFPTIVVNDEGIVLGEANNFLNQLPLNPFTTEHYSMPTLYMVMDSVAPRIFGASLESYRLWSALLGALSVLGTLLLGRRLFGERIGLASAGILVLMPLHVWASRNALNNIGDAFAFVFALYFLDRALTTRRRWDAVLSGIVLGLGFYGYFGARVFPLVMGLAACVAVVIPIYGKRLPVREMIRLGFWMFAGFVICAAPILGYFSGRPDIFMARFRSARVESSVVPSILDRIVVVQNALLYPFIDRQTTTYGVHGGIFFRHDPPFLGWFVAPFVMIGLVCWGVWAVCGLIDRQSRLNPARPRPEVPILTWIVISAGISQTEGLESQRFLSMSIIWALAAGTGVIVLIAGIDQFLHWNTRRYALLLLAAMIGIGSWNANFYFSEDRQNSMYGDRDATAVWDIAWRTQQLEVLPPIVLAGSVWMSYEGYGQWTYMVPGLAGLVTDVPEFGTDIAKAPVVVPGELLVVGGKRSSAEVCTVQTRNPLAMKGEARDRYGTLLYTVFTTGPTLLLTTAETPGQSTFEPIDRDLCAKG